MASVVKATIDATDGAISKLKSCLPNSGKIRAIITRKMRILIRGDWTLFCAQLPLHTPLNTPLCKDDLVLASYPGSNSTLWVLSLVFVTCVADVLDDILHVQLDEVSKFHREWSRSLDSSSNTAKRQFPGIHTCMRTGWSTHW